MTTWFCSCGEVIEATEERQDAAVRHSRIGTKHVLTNYDPRTPQARPRE